MVESNLQTTEETDAKLPVVKAIGAIAGNVVAMSLNGSVALMNSDSPMGKAAAVMATFNLIAGLTSLISYQHAADLKRDQLMAKMVRAESVRAGRRPVF